MASLLIGPFVALFALDRAVVLSASHWQWAAREVPPLVLDPYRLEAIARTTAPGRHNVVLLGNSIAERGLSSRGFGGRYPELRFPKLTIGGTPAATFAMLADRVTALEPCVAVYVASAPALRGHGSLDHIYAFDFAAAREIFSTQDWLAEPTHHLAGLLGQMHVLARHRRALQRAALVRMGMLTWAELELQSVRIRMRHVREGDDGWQMWIKGPPPSNAPNANTRALAYLARKLASSGSRLVVVEAPMHPSAALLAGPRVEHFRERMTELAAASGFDWIPSARLPELTEEHFADMVHANRRGRRILTEALADELEPFLGQGS